MLAFVLFNNSLVGHVRGSICLSISGTRAVVIKIQLDLIWGTMATRGGKYVYNGLGSSVLDMNLENHTVTGKNQRL